MKTYILGLFALLLMVSCYDGIDPISEVDPGPDAGAPVVTIIKPSNGLAISEPDPVSSINIEVKIEDDIEVGAITIHLDGTEIASYEEGSYVDYRIVTKSMTYDNITIGEHTLTVTATDLAGNTTTTTSNFSKEPPYTPMYPGEIFYMSFNGDYTDLVSSTAATEVGSPSFSDDAISGKSYQGAPDSYLTFSSAELAKGQNFGATFWLKVDASTDRAGIINIAPAEPGSPSDKPSGFGLIREGGPTAQKFILLVGNGTNATWLNPGDPATIDPSLNEWVHFGISISETNLSLFMNGELVGEITDFEGMDWTGVGDLAIMSGGPNFSGWDHKTEKGQMDELRLYNKTLSQSEVQTIMLKDKASLYMSFDGNYKDAVSGEEATEAGSPSFDFGNGVSGDAYQGAADSYLTFPSEKLAQGENFSAAFWLKIDASSDRAGILNIAPAEPGSPSDKPSGFGLIREGGETAQKFILLVGNGTNATWLNPGDPATIDPSLGEWVHFGIVISQSSLSMYMNGELVGEDTAFAGIDWTDVGDLAIMSGGPNFSGWDHKTEKGKMDELYLFNKALSAHEVNLLMNDLPQ